MIDLRRRTFAAWLQSQIDARDGWTGGTLARQAGLPRQTVYSWLNESRLPDPESCAKIADALGLHVDIVLGKAGHRVGVEPLSRYAVDQRLRAVEQQLRFIEEDVATGPGSAIPLIGVVPADSVRWVSVSEQGRTVEVPAAWVEESRAPLVAVEVSGDCLTPIGIASGDTVICERPEHPQQARNGDIVVIRIGLDEYTMKVWTQNGHMIELRDGHGEVIHTLSLMDEFEVVGIAVHKIGSLRRSHRRG